MSATINLEKKHFPVLLDELIKIISPRYSGTFLDCTFGQGGYSKKILNFKNTKVIAIDRDQESKKKADEISNNFKDRFLFKNKKFSQISDLKLKNLDIRGAVFDLGYSFSQIKDPKKGLSFNSTGNLNMRMGINDFSAQDVINKLDATELEKIFKHTGPKIRKIRGDIVSWYGSRALLTFDYFDKEFADL